MDGRPAGGYGGGGRVPGAGPGSASLGWGIAVPTSSLLRIAIGGLLLAGLVPGHAIAAPPEPAFTGWTRQAA